MFFIVSGFQFSIETIINCVYNYTDDLSYEIILIVNEQIWIHEDNFLIRE